MNDGIKMAKEQKLLGLNVAIFESRLAKTMADLVSLQGGTPFSAPSMKEVPLENNPEAFRFAEKLFKKEVDVLILLTGVGTRALVSVLETRTPRALILEALKNIQIVPRGPKPIKALFEMGVPFALTVPEPNTWREILETLDQNKNTVPVKDRVVAIQEYGVPNAELVAGLESRGAKVLPVPVYRWELPDDLSPLRAAIQKIVAGEIDILMITTAVQIEHLFQVAQQMKLETSLKTAFLKIVIASVGPDASEAIRSRGLTVDIQPEIPKMGPLVIETAQRAREILKLKRDGDTCAAEVFSAVLQLTREDELQSSPFLKACRIEKTRITPVWLMRQAGRYMKDYRLIRERVPFLELCKNVELVTEVTVTAQEKIKADAAIIFSDILLIVESFGLGLEYTKGDGPSIKRPIVTAEDVDRMVDIDPLKSLSYVLDAIRSTRKALKADIPLIGFAGAPFTLASYMIEGGASKDFLKTKNLMKSDEGLWRVLMEKIVKATATYLNGQVDAGVQAVQLFDSWVGCLSAEEYKKYVLPFSKKLIGLVKSKAPVIHFGTGTGPFLEDFAGAGSQVVGVDHRVRLDEAWKRVGYNKAIQGNLDPMILFKTLPEIKAEVLKILAYANGHDGYIFNLGHGVLPETPVENVIALVDMVHELSNG